MLNRFFAVNCLLLLLFSLLVYRLVDLAVFQRPWLLDIAKKQHNIKVQLEPRRGDILDRNNKTLATTVKSPSVYAIPRMIPKKNKADIVRHLAEALDLDENWLDTRLARDKAFVWVKRKVTEEEVDAVMQLGNPYISVQNEYKRFYPHSKEFSHVLGFCNIDNEGIEGLELAYDPYLKGEKGYRHSKRDALGREIPALEEKVVPPVNGRNLVLHVDEFIQHVVERELDKAFTKWNPKGACAIVMDPQSGQILAMANRPGFDTNHYRESTVDARRNRCITDFYEPGSIFKVITLAAALNEKKVSLEDTFDCERGTWQISGRRVIHDVHPYGNLTVPEILIKSSNIGTVKIGKLLGEADLYRYIKLFGFGEATGIGIQGEVSGIVHPLNKWSKISITSVPYGQEVAATALQMVRAMAVVANGGYLVKPQIIKEVRDEYGVVIKKPPTPAKIQVIEPETAKAMSDMLVRVVVEGTGKSAAIKGITVAGKTGTSQKINPGGGYSHTNFIGSFMGFAPAENPRLAMVVMIDDPRPMYYGGVVAAPVFKTAMEESLLYLGYSPKIEEKSEETPAPAAKKAEAPSAPEKKAEATTAAPAKKIEPVQTPVKKAETPKPAVKKPAETPQVPQKKAETLRPAMARQAASPKPAVKKVSEPQKAPAEKMTEPVKKTQAVPKTSQTPAKSAAEPKTPFVPKPVPRRPMVPKREVIKPSSELPPAPAVIPSR